MPNPSPPIRLPLFSPIGSRDQSFDRDSRLYNGFAEKGQGDDSTIYIYKRPGINLLQQVGSPGDKGNGVYRWSGVIYSIFGSTFYAGGTSKGAVDGSKPYTFAPCLGATPKLFFQNTVAAYTYDPINGVVQVTDSNYPTGVVPGAEYLDGTNYVFTSSASLDGSDFNDPTTWDPLNVILAQIDPSAGVALAKQLVYILAMKETETEVFYDAGNPAGSPLGPVQGSKIGVGCLTAGSVAKAGDDVCWLGTTTEGDVQVMFMSKVKADAISTPPVERLLKGLNWFTTYSFCVKVAGHRFYILTSKASNVSLCFDISAGAWYIWTDPSGNYFPVVGSTYDGAGDPILQGESSGALYNFLETVYSDLGSVFAVKAFTPAFDGGLRLSKMCSKIEVIGDKISTQVQVSWSDDDYQTFNTPRPVSLDTAFPSRPWLNDGSTFDRRAYCVTHFDNTPLRIAALDLTLQAGTS